MNLYNYEVEHISKSLYDNMQMDMEVFYNATNSNRDG